MGELTMTPSLPTIAIEPVIPESNIMRIRPVSPFVETRTFMVARTATESAVSRDRHDVFLLEGVVRLQAPPFTSVPSISLWRGLLRDGQAHSVRRSTRQRQTLAAMRSTILQTHGSTVAFSGSVVSAVITHKVPAPVSGDESARAPTLQGLLRRFAPSYRGAASGY